MGLLVESLGLVHVYLMYLSFWVRMEKALMNMPLLPKYVYGVEERKNQSLHAMDQDRCSLFKDKASEHDLNIQLHSPMK